MSFGPLAETHSPTGYEEDNSTLVKPMFFHRPSMTSTYDLAESIATLPPESDLDDDQIRKYVGFTAVFTGERSKCTQGGKDELTSTVQSAWQKPPVRRKGGRVGRVSGRHVVRGRQSSPTLEVRRGNRQGW